MRSGWDVHGCRLLSEGHAPWQRATPLGSGPRPLWALVLLGSWLELSRGWRGHQGLTALRTTGSFCGRRNVSSKPRRQGHMPLLTWTSASQIPCFPGIWAPRGFPFLQPGDQSRFGEWKCCSSKKIRTDKLRETPGPFLTSLVTRPVTGWLGKRHMEAPGPSEQAGGLREGSTLFRGQDRETAVLLGKKAQACPDANEIL